MRGEREDRRVRRTKDRLKAALLELIDEVGYDRITVRDLTDRADVGRSTFYSHFDSKEDLLFSGFDRWLLSLADAAEGDLVLREPGGAGPEAARSGEAASGDPGGAPVPRFRFSLPLLEHARGQRRFFQAVVLRGGRGRVRRRLMALLVDVARRELEREDGNVDGRGSVALSDPDRERDARAHAVVGAFLGLLTWWFEDGRGVEAGEVDRLFQDAVG